MRFGSMESQPQAATAINTKSGRLLDFAAPTVEAIVIDDIASGLAKVPRFGAQAQRFHSVAQHAIAVSLIVEGLGRPDLALAALHHDSHEAYACDIPRPLKLLLEPSYSEITNRLDAAIAEAFGFEPYVKASEDGAVIKAADDAAFAVEARVLLAGPAPEVHIDSTVLEAAERVVRPWLERQELGAVEGAFADRHVCVGAALPSPGRPSEP